MRIIYGWAFLISIILLGFYYVNENLEKTVRIDDFLRLSKLDQEITYSAKKYDNESDIVNITFDESTEIIILNNNQDELLDKEKTLLVEVNRANKNVVLVLLSKNYINWEIVPKNNTNISLIVYDEISNVKSKYELYKKSDNLTTIDSYESKDIINLLDFLNQNLSLRENIYIKDIENKNINLSNMDSFQKISLDIFKPDEINKNIDFELLTANYEYISFDLFGPKNKNQQKEKISFDIVSAPLKNKCYKIEENGISIFDFESKNILNKPIPILKTLSYPKGIAYDSSSNRVFLADKFGKFYVFDAAIEQWSSIRKYIEDFDINSLSYDVLSNSYLATTWKKEGLLIFDYEGNLSQEINLEGKLRGLNYFYSKGDEVPQIYVVAQGNDIALIFEDEFVKQIWYYDKSLNKTYLTYNYYYSANN